MYEFYPYFTNDGSVGLYSPQDDDIYHSTYGALTEAYEKFIFPANLDNYFKSHNKIKILDICFGIGYNSKAFLNYFFENFDKKISALNSNIDTIHTDNKFNEIFIRGIETDKNLVYLSPFIKTSKKINRKNKINFTNEKITRLLSEKTKIKYNCKNFVNIILLRKIIKTSPEIFDNFELEAILKNKKYKKYFDANLIELFNFYKSQGNKYTLLGYLNAFLHNIYYRYISTSYKKALKYLKLNDLTLELDFRDARESLKDDSNIYNFIFLDAFTPAKCPCLWTIEFFKLLHEHLDDDGLILTYSNSAAIRNAFIKAGFWTGKIYNKENDKFMGTIAAKKLENIKTGLSDYDLGLINTKAGICYRDNEKLSLDNNTILKNHEQEVAESKLISSSKFIKTYRSGK